MAVLDLRRKLAILSDAAKYDASCASSGAEKRTSVGGQGVGSTEGMGICHAYAPDGRCISLLKILLTNFCIYDCAYCINRVSSNTPRARFTVKEVVDLTLNFYKRNYIEGLFLSSGVIRTGDYTMEEMVRVAKSLRLDHDFRGYIHLKLIPEASPELAAEAGLYADRVSINIELPRDDDLKALAPEKSPTDIKRAMGRMRLAIDDHAEPAKKAGRRSFARSQSTQLIVGADEAKDGDILARSASLYGAYRLGVQSDPRRQPPPALVAAAAAARASPLPGRLADALLWLRAARDRGRGRGPGPDGRSQDQLGAAEPGALPGRRPDRRQGDAAARAGSRRQGCRTYPGRPESDPPDPR
jgi:predicted DNA-binding helix-hairpin-helix protein